MTVAETAVFVHPPEQEILRRPSPGPDPPPAETLEAALRLEALGLSVIPLQPGSKLPARPWKRWQTKRPAPALLRRWWRENPACNWGIMTGQVSGLVVLDVDGQPGRESIRGKHLPPTPTAKTPGGGLHYYYRLPPGKTWRSRAGLRPGLDVRCAGGYVVAAGSQRKDGKAWSWAIPFERREDLADPPAWLCELLEEPPRSAQEGPGAGAGEEVGVLPGELPPGVEEGARNCRAAQLIGGWLSLGLPAEEVWARALAWNQMNLPPLPERELWDVLRSLLQRESAKPPGGRGARIPRVLLEAGARGQVSWSAVVLAATWAGLRQTALGRPQTADLAQVLGVTRRSVRAWRQELREAELWGVGEECPRRRFVTIRLDLLKDPSLPPAVKATALVVASFVSEGRAQVGQAALAQVRGVTRQTIAEHLKALGELFIVLRSSYVPAERRRRSCNVYIVHGGTGRAFTSAGYGPVNGRRANMCEPLPEGVSRPPPVTKAEAELTYLKASIEDVSGGRVCNPVGTPGAAPNAPLPERVNLPAAILRVIPYNLALEYLTERGYTESDLLAFCALFEEGGGNSE